MFSLGQTRQGTFPEIEVDGSALHADVLPLVDAINRAHTA